MQTMRIARLLGQCEVVIEEVPTPQPGRGEVLIKTAASALCGSEMGGYRKDGVATGNIGHEAAGVVAQLGEGVETLRVGQRVGACPVAGCGTCDYCLQGQNTWCEKWRFFGAMHAEYFLVPAHSCLPLPDDVPWNVGVLITGDGLGVPWHTSKKISGDEIRTVAIFGLGPVGLSNVLMQKYLGRRVIGIDRAPQRLELAQSFGAETLFADENTPAIVRELTDGKGADVCLEAAGSPVTAKQCFASARKGGIVVFNGEQGPLELSPSEDFIRRDITAIGSWFYHFGEFGEMLNLYRSGLPIASLITHCFPLEHIADGYRAMNDGLTGKVLIEYP
jgi:threonine dehydrogenase-like Zn-dependent dehydrogenase